MGFILKEDSYFYPKSKKVTLLQAVSNLYLATLDGGDFKKVKLPIELKPYADTLYTLLGFNSEKLIQYTQKLKLTVYREAKDTQIFLYTGGKDSLASYLKYKKDTAKHKLLFIHGLNQLYPLEKSVLDKHREILKTDIDIMDVKLPRLKNQIEHPVKNLFTYVLAMDYYNMVPYKFSFGFITYEDLAVSLSDEWGGSGNEDLDDIISIAEYDAVVDSLEGEVEEAVGSPQVSEAVGDGKRLSFRSLELLHNTYNIDTTGGVKDTIETFSLVEESGLMEYLSSCMSLTAFRAYNKKKTEEKYAVTIEGVPLVGGAVYLAKHKSVLKILKNKSSFYAGIRGVEDLKGKRYLLEEKGKVRNVKNPLVLKLKDLHLKTKIGIYECSVCFKCCERYIIQDLHLGYNYDRDFLLSRYRLLLESILKSSNSNNIDFSYYMEVELGIDETLLKELKDKKILSANKIKKISEMLQ